MRAVGRLELFSFGRKRKHIRWLPLAAELAIEFLNGSVADKNHDCGFGRKIDDFEGALRKVRPGLLVDLPAPLAIQNFDHQFLECGGLTPLSPSNQKRGQAAHSKLDFALLRMRF